MIKVILELKSQFPFLLKFTHSCIIFVFHLFLLLLFSFVFVFFCVCWLVMNDIFPALKVMLCSRVSQRNATHSATQLN
jgi:hypothetical protein